MVQACQWMDVDGLYSYCMGDKMASHPIPYCDGKDNWKSPDDDIKNLGLMVILLARVSQSVNRIKGGGHIEQLLVDKTMNRLILKVKVKDESESRIRRIYRVGVLMKE